MTATSRDRPRLNPQHHQSPQPLSSHAPRFLAMPHRDIKLGPKPSQHKSLCRHPQPFESANISIKAKRTPESHSNMSDFPKPTIMMNLPPRETNTQPRTDAVSQSRGLRGCLAADCSGLACRAMIEMFDSGDLWGTLGDRSASPLWAGARQGPWSDAMIALWALLRPRSVPNVAGHRVRD